MSINKNKILQNFCYTELVYGRINKKLNSTFSKQEIEKTLLEMIKQTEENFIEKIGKNIYIINREKKIRITINSNTYPYQ
jgi:hypothetical protein